MTPQFYVPGFTTPPISLTRSTTAGAGAVWVWRTVLFAMSCNVRHLGVSRAWLEYGVGVVRVGEGVVMLR